MAASKKFDSCSPTSSRPTNSNPRNSEIGNPMRRSFTGSPFVKPSIISNQRGGGGFNPNTPVNSPSDYPRRNPISRENIVVTLRDHEDKENGKDQNWKSVRIRSPAKGTKNFMSPTISAASKINASPRKKILADRNEQIRTSFSFSDAKNPLMEGLESKPDKGLNQRKEVSFGSTVTYLVDNEDSKSEEGLGDLVVDSSAKDDLDLSSENLTVEKGCANLDSSFKISPRVSCSLPSPVLAPLDADPLPSPVLAPLDADPSLRPYDPKNNYLSPRPQFLHYRPNPRIELYLNKERDGQPLEEIFASECSSETEVSEAEDSHSDDSRKESDASLADEVKESDASSGDEVKEEESEELLLVSEPNPISTYVEEKELLVSEPNSICTSLEMAEEKGVFVNKSHLFTRRKFTALLFVLAVGFLYVSVSKSPVMDPSVLNNLTFPEPYIPPELSEYTRQRFEALTQKVQLWLHHSLCYTHNLIYSFRGGHNLGSLQYANLTILVEDGNVDRRFALDQIILGSTVKYEEKVLEPTKEEADIKLVDEPSATDEEIIEVVGDNKDGDFDSVPDAEGVNVPESIEVNLLPQSEVSEPGKPSQEDIQENAETAANVVELQSNIDLEDQSGLIPEDDIQESAETAGNIVELQSNIDHEDQNVLIPQAAETQPEILNSIQFQEIDFTSADIESTAAEKKFEILAGSATENLRSSESLNTKSGQIIVGISLVVFCLLGTVFIYMKSGATATRNATSTADQVPMTKNCSPLSVAAEHTDIAGESCSSEMSSFSLSYSKKGQKGTGEAPSYERKPRKNNHRRESMASSDYSISSMGSPSYGSFTTYEKVPSKHGIADEEVITPVRRSSRIRNHFTSP